MAGENRSVGIYATHSSLEIGVQALKDAGFRLPMFRFSIRRTWALMTLPIRKQQRPGRRCHRGQRRCTDGGAWGGWPAPAP